MTIAPGSVIGIVGGGQLGRMLALAAAQLGYKCHIYAPDESPPAAEVSARFTRGAWDDEGKLALFAREIEVATFEFENISASALGAVAEHAPLYPPVRSLEIAQDRLAEKQFVLGLGGRPAPFAAVDDLAGLETALGEIGAPAILKTRRFGYDGKGQVRISENIGAAAAWDEIGGAPSVLEGFITFDAEFSVLLCRGIDGETMVWDSPVNKHEDGILARSTVPAGRHLAAQVEQAVALARRAADSLGHVGMLTLEFFATDDGPIFNEMAPRVHNSGHWTIEGALTSQFENHVRAICGLPLGSCDLIAPRVEMRNLIGDDANSWREILSDPANHLHLYGKGEDRPGRKMGHVTRLLGVGD